MSAVTGPTNALPVPTTAPHTGMVNAISGWRTVLSTTVNVSATEVLGAAPPGECVTSRLSVDRARRLMDNNINPTPSLYMTKTVIGTPASAHVTETTHVPQRTQDESARNRRQRHLCADNARTPTDVVIGRTGVLRMTKIATGSRVTARVMESTTVPRNTRVRSVLRVGAMGSVRHARTRQGGSIGLVHSYMTRTVTGTLAPVIATAITTARLIRLLTFAIEVKVVPRIIVHRVVEVQPM